MICLAACSNKGAPTPDAGSELGDASSPDDAGTDIGETSDFGADVHAPDLNEACTYAVTTPENVPIPDRIHTPRWAFEPWISKDISDAADTYAFVDGFRSRDIPVGVVVLDSPWETNYNTFIPNPDRYPNFDQMVADLRSSGVRTVLWMTQLTNEGSFDVEVGGDIYDGAASNHAEALACGFFVNDGEQYTWWKGRGGSIDFFNPTARQWWHEQQDPLYELGIAGWKLDFGDSYVHGDTVRTAAGEVPHQQYSESYYKDFYDYGIHRLGHDEFVTMVRAWDESYNHEGRFHARPEHAPVVWVGDNRRDWFGLEDALDHIFRSAAAGYVVIGSDLGGYLDRDDKSLATRIPFDRTNFMRWLAQSALTPFMQLHGRANLTPWTLPDDPDPDESVAHYRFWSHLHTELIPFWYSLAEASYAGEASGIIRPLGAESTWAGDYRYMLGDALLVAPILDETGLRDVDVPDGQYYDWWDDQMYVGPSTFTFDVSDDLRRIPLLVKRGAIIPIVSSSDVAGLTEGGLGAADVVLTWPATTLTSFVVHDDDDQTTTVDVQDRTDDVRIATSRARRPLVVRLRFDDVVTSVTVDGVAVTEVSDEAGLLAQAAYRVDAPYLWISSPPSDDAVEILVTR